MAARPEPVIALLAQAGAVLRYDERLGELVPGDPLPGRRRTRPGHVLGVGDDGPDLGAASGARAGAPRRPRAAGAGGDARPASVGAGSTRRRGAIGRPRGRRHSADAGGRKQFVCLCEDVTVKELEQGVEEGFDRPRDAQALQHGHDGPVPGEDVPRRSRRASTRAISGERRPPRPA